MQNRDGVGRRSQSYLPTFGRARVDNAARLIHEYRLPGLERSRLSQGAHNADTKAAHAAPIASDMSGSRRYIGDGAKPAVGNLEP